MKVILYMATTLNGYIAQADDSTPWSDDAWNAYMTAVKKVGNIIIGKKTYEIMKTEELEKIGNPFTVVITRKQSSSENPNLFFAHSPEEALKIITKKGFTETLLSGGSQTIDLFMKKNLVNEVIIDVESFLLGEGKPLILPSKLELKLSLIDVRKTGENSVQLHYEVK